METIGLMKAILVGDIHLSDKPPSMRTDTYAEDVFAKLRHTVALATEHAVDAVIWAGDVFHVKTPSRTSHAIVQQVLELGSTYPCPWLIVPGNHDMQHDRLDSLDSQPLGTLFKSGKAILLIGAHTDLPLYGIPFLQEWTDITRWAAGYREWQQSNQWRDDRALIVTHAPIMPPGQTVPYEFIDAGDWAGWQGSGSCYYGHIHDTHGSYVAGDVVFCNQGALSRGSLHETDLRRKPAVTLYDSTPNAVRFHRLEIPHRPIADVMRLADHVAETGKVDRLDEFLSSIEGTTLDTISIEAAVQHINSLEAKPATKKVAIQCLEEAAS